MNRQTTICCVLVDIGGVLLSNSWDQDARQRAANHFSLDLTELNKRHYLNCDIYEIGKMTLFDYLNRVVFYQKRLFSHAQFQDFMFKQSTTIPDMMKLMIELKHKYGLKLVAFSNEGREINSYRIRHFKLDNIFDFFVSSCFVKMRKPDVDIFQMALDQVQTPVSKMLVIDSTSLFTEIARSRGMQAIHHLDYSTTSTQLAALGLSLPPVNHFDNSLKSGYK